MLITFQRLGHANNSSSSHSIIFAPNMQIENNDFTGLEYGWQLFTLSSRESKEKYMLTALFHNMIDTEYDIQTGEPKCNLEQYDNLIEKLKNHNKFSIFQNFLEIVQLFKTESYYYIDHQSAIRWPINRKTNELELDFYMDFCQEILENDYVILGGNDNDGNHPLEEAGSKNRADFLTIYESLVDSSEIYTYKDPLTREWILSNNSNYGENAGAILKAVFGYDLIDNVQFNDPVTFFSDEKLTVYKKSYSPYLVDLKINSFCSFGCEYCYTSSTVNGSHANFETIENVLCNLRNANVFEIVLGGGEPTLHPDILRIVKLAKNLQFKVGITTKNYNLHKHPDGIEIINTIDSLAFSINSEDDLAKAIACDEGFDCYYNARLYLQTILGLQDWNKTFDLIKKGTKTFRSFTLLGYKTFGFGKNQKAVSVNNDWFIQLKNWAKNEHGISIGVDSIIANKYREEFITAGVNWRNLVGAEGKSSCYIDCVESTISASSFTDNGVEKFDFSTQSVDEFLKIFAKF